MVNPLYYPPQHSNLANALGGSVVTNNGNLQPNNNKLNSMQYSLEALPPGVS